MLKENSQTNGLQHIVEVAKYFIACIEDKNSGAACTLLNLIISLCLLQTVKRIRKKKTRTAKREEIFRLDSFSIQT